MKRHGRSLTWLIVVFMVIGTVVGATRWLIVTESGLTWLAGVVESQSGGKVSITGISRTLLHPLKAETVQINAEGYRIILRKVYFDWQPAALLSGKLEVFSLAIRDAEVMLLESSGKQGAPEKVQIPVNLNVLKLSVDRMAIYRQNVSAPEFAAEDIEAQLSYDNDALQLQEFHARLKKIGSVTGKGTIGLVTPFVINAEATLQSAVKINEHQAPATINALADGNLSDLAIELDGNVAGVTVNGNMRLKPYAPIQLDSLSGSFSGVDPSRLYAPAPVADVSGKFDLRGVSREKLEGTLELVNKTSAPWDRDGLPIAKLTSKIALSLAELRLAQLVATTNDAGEISGTVQWYPQRDAFSGTVNITELTGAALHSKFPNSRLSGEISFEGQRQHQRVKLNLSDGRLSFQAAADLQDMQLELSEFHLQRGKASFAGQGRLTLDRNYPFTATGRLSHLDLADYAAGISTDINGECAAEGSLSPEVAGTLTLDVVDRMLFQHALHGNATVKVAGLSAVNAEAQIALRDNVINLTLQHAKDEDKLNIQLNASDLETLGHGLGGRLSATLEAEGNLKSPQLRFTLHGTGLLAPGGYHVTEVDTSGMLQDDQMTANLDLHGLGGSGDMNIRSAAVSISGTRVRQNLDASISLAQGRDMIGELTMTARGGVINSEDGWRDWKWRGAIGKLETRGLLPFTLRDSAPLILSGQAVYLGDASLDFKQGQARLDDLLWTPHMMHSAGRFDGINLRIVNQADIEGVSAPLTAMGFAGLWDVTSGEHLNGDVELRRERDKPEPAANGSSPSGIEVLELLLHAESDKLRGNLTINSGPYGRLTAHADVPIAPASAGWTIRPDAPLTGRLNLKSDNLSWLAPMLDTNLASAGAIEADLEMAGTVSLPRLRGNLQGDGLFIGLIDQGIRLEDGELRARFDGSTIQLDRLDFVAPHGASPQDDLFGDYKVAAGSGKLSASGKIDLDGDSSRLLITAQHVPLFQRSDRWVIASGTGHARYAGKALHLDGNIRADAGLINQPVSDRPRLSDDVRIVGEAGSNKSPIPYGIFGTLELGDHFYIRASGLEARLSGNLDVRKETKEPLSVTGIIAAQNAVFEAYGQRLQVERGMVNFQGKLDDPGLNILALRKGLSVEAGVEVTGTVRRPVARLVSTPNVPDGEKLSWIMLGRVPESSGVDNSLLIASAINILGGQTAGQFSRALGVDEISINQQAGTDSSLSQKVTVGKRLSTRASISYEKDLNETGGVTRFTYTLTPRITLVTRSGTEDALDVFYSFRFY